MTEASALCRAARGRGRSHDSETAASHGFRASPSGKDERRGSRDRTRSGAGQVGRHGCHSLPYLRYRNNVCGCVLSILRDDYEAEDAIQTVFIKLMSVIHKYEPRQAPLTAWILRVARNVTLDSLRQRRPVPCEEVIESWRPADDSSHDRRWALEQALDRLPEYQRKVVVLRHLAGLSPGEIAHRVDRTEASIHGLHHPARVTLRRELVRAECAPTTSMGALTVSDTVQVVLDVTLPTSQARPRRGSP
jgi:RNA polymerase sigma-70 factor (ECF subfamily)